MAKGTIQGKRVVKHKPATGAEQTGVISAAKFRLFIGNLSETVDVPMVETSFAKYKSVESVQVIPRKGYGFISFGSAQDYLHAFREMNGKIIGSKPITLNRAKSNTPIGKPKR